MVANIWALEGKSLLHKVSCQYDGRGVHLLTDFAAAFPSVLHSWVRAVLEALGLPLPLLRFLLVLYENSATTIVYDFMPRGSFPFRRGIRQGCPSSMLIFCFILDPLLRWLCDRVLSTFDWVAGYADDLGFAIMDWQVTLPRLGVAFAVLSRGTGLTLHLRKCYLLPYSVATLCALRRFVKRSLRWKDCVVLLAARYLGAFLGPHAYLHVWQRPLARCRRAALHIQSEHLGFARSAVLFNQKGAGALSFIAQLYVPQRSVLAAYHDITQLITAAPRNALAGRMLTRGRQLGLGVEVVDLEVLSRAARFRLACSTNVASEWLAKVQRARQGDGLAVAPTEHWARNHVHATSLYQVHLALADEGLASLRGRSHGNVQRVAVRIMNRLRPACCANALLSRRIAHWLPLVNQLQVPRIHSPVCSNC